MLQLFNKVFAGIFYIVYYVCNHLDNRNFERKCRYDIIVCNISFVYIINLFYLSLM